MAPHPIEKRHSKLLSTDGVVFSKPNQNGRYAIGINGKRRKIEMRSYLDGSSEREGLRPVMTTLALISRAKALRHET